MTELLPLCGVTVTCGNGFSQPESRDAEKKVVRGRVASRPSRGACILLAGYSGDWEGKSAAEDVDAPAGVFWWGDKM